MSLLALAAIPVIAKLIKGGGGGNRADQPYDSGSIQKFLPPELRAKFMNQFLEPGIRGIGGLIQNPGSLSPNVADAIRPRLAIESQNIAQNFRGIASNQAGAAARGNVPLSIKTALQSALDIAQERAQRGARSTALAESGQLQRQDLGQTLSLLELINQFIGTRVGSATQQSIASQQQRSQDTASWMALLGSLASSGASK